MEVERLSDSRPWHAHYDYWVRPHLNYPRRPLTDILRIAAADVPDRPATAFLGRQLTFAEVKERADKFATALSRMNVKQGDRVGVMLPNCPQYIIAVFGILRIGAIVDLVGRRVELNPVVVFIRLLFWFWLWGVPGAILAMPLLAILKIICDRVHPLKALGHFLEGE